MIRFYVYRGKLYRTSYGRSCVWHHLSWRYAAVPDGSKSISEEKARRRIGERFASELHKPAGAYPDLPVDVPSRPPRVEVVTFDTEEEAAPPPKKKAKRKAAKKKTAKRKASRKKRR